jgi:diguanylate cyclase (GGDEF)-like protein
MTTIYDLEKVKCNKFANVVVSRLLSITFALLTSYLALFTKENYIIIGSFALITVIYIIICILKLKTTFHMHLIFGLGNAAAVIAALSENAGDIIIPVFITIASLFYFSRIPLLYSITANFCALVVLWFKYSPVIYNIIFLGCVIALIFFAVGLRRFICNFLLAKIDEYDKIHYCSQHDPLTGLPNRLLFYDRLNQAISQAARTGKYLAVIFLDLDSFKKINDTAGHLTGDKLLLEVGKRIQNELRDNDTLARFGGDEFVVLLPYMDDASDAGVVEERIRNAFLPPFYVDETSYHISSAIGKAVYPTDANDVEGLINSADLYMLKTKKRIPV